MNMERVHTFVRRGACESQYDATQTAMLGDGMHTKARRGAERTIERMAGVASEQREDVVAVEREQRAGQVPDVGGVSLALSLGAVRVDTKVQGTPPTFACFSERPSRSGRREWAPAESAHRARATTDRRTRDPSASTRRSPPHSGHASAITRSGRVAWRAADAARP